MDLAAVTGWTTLGQGGIIRASLRLANAGRALELAAAPGPAPTLITEGDPPALRVHGDLAAALAAHGAQGKPTGEIREWRSSDWPYPHTCV
jgi:hypothetical protein